MAHYALQRLKISPYVLYQDLDLDPAQVRAFIFASSIHQIESEAKARKEAEAKARHNKK